MPRRRKLLSRSRAIAALMLALPISIVVALGLSQGTASPNLNANTSGGAVTSSTTAPTTTSSTSTPPGYTPPPPQTVTYPSPYNPGYSTISQLVKDSTFIVMGTLGAPVSESKQNGGTVAVYPIEVERDFGTFPPRMAIGLSSAEFEAGKLTVNGTYIFFWASDPVDSNFCIVGGARGMFAYNSTNDTVSRVDATTASQIPPSQTLEQFNTSVQAAETQLQSQPTTNPPPMCSTSATGIAS